MSKSNDVVVLTAGLGGGGEEEGVSMVDGAVCGAVHWWYGWCGRGTFGAAVELSLADSDNSINGISIQGATRSKS